MTGARQRLIIDTDVGTDVDDLWTLAMLPACDEVQVEAVTVVYGDVDLRARLAAVVCDAMRLGCPVHAGRTVPLSDTAVMWAGHEGDGVVGLDDATYSPVDAVDVLTEQAERDPGTLHVLAIGPLTDIASAIDHDSSFASNLMHLTVMGGELTSDYPEHNFSSDASATQIVLESGVEMTVVPLDQTLRVRLDATDASTIATAHPIGPLLEDQAHRFWAWLDTVVPGVFGESSPAHDPIALLTLLRPDLFEFTPMAIDTSLGDGRVRGEADATSPIRVVTDLDERAVHHELLARLTRRSRLTRR